MERLRTVFNHDTAHAYPELSEARIAFQSGRALIRTAPGDVIQLHPGLAPEFDAIVEHYRGLGIECANEVVWDTSPEVISEFPGAEWSIFIFARAHHGLRPNNVRLAATEMFDRKNEFVPWCKNLGFPVPQTIAFERGGTPDLDGLEYPLYVKASWATGGLGVVECSDQADVVSAVAAMDSDYQLQRTVPADRWVNILYEAERGTAKHLVTTEQRIDRSVWVGSRYPSEYDPRRVTDPVAAAMALKGIEGPFGIDVGVIERGGDVEFVIIEANPRLNASTYFWWAAERIGAAQWMGAKLPTRHRRLEPLLAAIEDLTYLPQSGEGIVIGQWNTLSDGKVGVLFAGNKDQQDGLYAEVTRRLG
ncbi:ATP-grasp domain-containing protein [Smaragdicoccus niigatensis]|uniref:ATP-grasp domain-containing protein n=1 Tax=Smaragdicoccus niigatensis TaxID=359359 RepID=UPI00037F57DE|nr:ATP-grasp domain-containing protein [Smaragdicoccus niigatensis]